MAIKLTVLTDNLAGPHLFAEHGLSYLIEADETILFDTGASDVFLKNAEKLSLSLDPVKKIVLSHGHWDHGDGLPYLRDKELVAHPGVFANRLRKTDQSYQGIALSRKEAEKKYKLCLSTRPVQLSDSITFLGEIPRANDFEKHRPTAYIPGQGDDMILDDTALAITSPKGLIVITGCSHAGIVNICEHAKNVTGQNGLYAVAGGFHTRKVDEALMKVIGYFEEEEVVHLYPSHCTAFQAAAIFYRHFKQVDLLKTGDVIEF